MMPKTGFIIGGVIIIAVLLVLLVIMHYERVNEFKERLGSAQSENARLVQESHKEKLALSENYGKGLERLRQEYQLDVRDTKRNAETMIQTLETEYQAERVKEGNAYQEKLTALESEYARLSKLLDDPDKRIPILIAERHNMVKQLSDLYTGALEEYRTRCAEAKRQYQQARNDAELFIDVNRCQRIAALCRSNVASFKSFAEDYRRFLKGQESALNEIGLDYKNHQTSLEQALVETERVLADMEHENNQLSEVHLKINAAQDWQDTGIPLEVGDFVHISAGNGWSIRPKKYPECTADGGPDLPAKYRRPGFEKTNTGALVTRIKNKIELLVTHEGQPGNKFSFTAEVKGRLELTINDTDWKDNSGELIVRIVIKKVIY